MNQRRTIFLVLCLMYILAYFYRVSLAVVAKDVSRDLALSAAQLGTLSGVFFYIYAFVQIPLGPLLDRFGGRMVIFAFGILTTVGSLLFAEASGFESGMAARLLIGAGTSCVLMGALKLYTGWYSKTEFATVSGLMVAVGNIGNLCGTAPLAAAAARFGWRPSFVFVSVVQAVVTLLILLIVRERKVEAEEHEEEVSMIGAWRVIFRSRRFWLTAVMAFFWYGAYMVLQGLWGGPYLIEAVGLPRTSAGNLLLCTSLGFMSGCLLLGRMTRLLGSDHRVLFFGQTALTLLLAIMLFSAERVVYPALQFLFLLIGLSVSSGITIYPIIRRIFPVRIIATGLTSVNFFVLMGAATVQQGMGFIIQQWQKGANGYPPEAYHKAFLLPVAGLLLAVLLFHFLWPEEGEKGVSGG